MDEGKESGSNKDQVVNIHLIICYSNYQLKRQKLPTNIFSGVLKRFKTLI